MKTWGEIASEEEERTASKQSTQTALNDISAGSQVGGQFVDRGNQYVPQGQPMPQIGIPMNTQDNVQKTQHFSPANQRQNTNYGQQGQSYAPLQQWITPQPQTILQPQFQQPMQQQMMPQQQPMQQQQQQMMSQQQMQMQQQQMMHPQSQQYFPQLLPPPQQQFQQQVANRYSQPLSTFQASSREWSNTVFKYPNGGAMGDPSTVIPIACPPMKMIAWALMKVVISLYDSLEEGQSAGMQAVEKSRLERFKFGLLTTAKTVSKYIEGEPDACKIVERMIVKPLLDIVQQYGHLYCTKLPIPPSMGNLKLDGTTGANLNPNYYQLHTFFSASYYFFTFRVFTHNLTPVPIAIGMAEEFIKCILSVLFNLEFGQKGEELEFGLLFQKIGETIDILRTFTSGAFVQDHLEDASFVEKSSVSNAFMEILRRSALKSIQLQFPFFPSLMGNPIVMAQLDHLHISGGAPGGR